MEPLSPYALGTLDELLRHLGHGGSATEGDRDRGVAAGNRAVGWMERVTARSLRVRTHRNTVTLTLGDWSAGASVVTGIASTTDAKVHDDVVGAGVPLGTRIVSVDSASQITVNTVFEAAGTNVTLTAGSRPLVTDGVEGTLLWIPETPVVEVYGVKWRDSDGALTSLDLTGARLQRETGEYVIPNDSLPAGSVNIEIECCAGYTPPSATERGDWRDWENLKGIWLRVSEVYYQEKTRHAGRISSQNLGQTSLDYRPNMPADVLDDIEAYVRRP